MPSSGFLRRLLIGLVAGLVIGTVAMLGLSVLRKGKAAPRLTPELFRAAVEKWEKVGSSDYDIEIQVTGNQPATYFVEVRGGEARLALRNGKPLTQRRTFSTWSVPGMFATMSRDVDALERRAAGQTDRSVPDLHLRAAFDPQYGYPAHYQRMEHHSVREVEWHVTRFEIVNQSKRATD